MRLSYRGQGYEYEAAEANSVEGGSVGRYRWQSGPVTYPRHVATPATPTLNSPTQDVVQREESEDLTTVPFRCDSAGMVPGGFASHAIRRSTITKVGAPSCFNLAHLQSIHERLEHRLMVAIARGDKSLVAQLEKEMSQIACPIA